jgi:hypothetical protein
MIIIGIVEENEDIITKIAERRCTSHVGMDA